MEKQRSLQKLLRSKELSIQTTYFLHKTKSGNLRQGQENNSFHGKRKLTFYVYIMRMNLQRLAHTIFIL